MTNGSPRQLRVPGNLPEANKAGIPPGQASRVSTQAFAGAHRSNSIHTCRCIAVKPRESPRIQSKQFIGRQDGADELLSAMGSLNAFHAHDLGKPSSGLVVE